VPQWQDGNRPPGLNPTLLPGVAPSMSPHTLGLPHLDLPPYLGPDDDPEPRPGGWVAAVSVVLREADPGSTPVGQPSAPDLLLIRRAAHDRDPWSGHMALPGGKRDPADTSLLQTAHRETLEEVDIELASLGRTLGRLDPVIPRNAHLPPLTILPLVFAVPPGTRARIAAPAEVAELHWVPLDLLQDPATRTTYRYPPAGELAFPAFDVAGRSVWGLTHRVLSDLLRRLSAG
jgi:8-oxo-dGTP pyrophosphatase MutT (NUDIX family)